VVNAVKDLDAKVSSGASFHPRDLALSGAFVVQGAVTFGGLKNCGSLRTDASGTLLCGSHAGGSTGAFGSGVTIQLSTARGSDTALRVLSNVNGTGTTVLRVNASGAVFSNSTFNSNGADYAEWSPPPTVCSRANSSASMSPVPMRCGAATGPPTRT